MKRKKLLELIYLLKELDDDLIRCMKCGMCQAACPLYKTTLLETDVARGKLALISHLIKELIEKPEEVKKNVNRCLLCGSCAANCPSGVDVIKIFLKTRTIITKFLKLSLIERIVLRDIVAKPKLFDLTFKIASKLQQPLTKQQNPSLGSVSCNVPFLKNRFFVPPKEKTFLKKVQKKRNINGQKVKVGIFAGCLVDKFFPHIGLCIVSILEELDVGYFIPDVQICCGIPSISSGDLESFKTMVLHLVELYPIDKIDYIVTPCASCTSTIKKIWPMFLNEFDENIKKKILAVSSKTMDISEFLIKKTDILSKLKVNQYREKIKITYHDPCHLKKSLGIYKEPRNIIALNNNYELIEMEDADVCCGMGGSFNIKHYDISKKIGLKKAQNILKTNAKVVATSCPACMLQIIDMLSHINADISVKHPVEILQDGIKNKEGCSEHNSTI